jgi:hypothetical protein
MGSAVEGEADPQGHLIVGDAALVDVAAGADDLEPPDAVKLARGAGERASIAFSMLSGELPTISTIL